MEGDRFFTYKIENDFYFYDSISAIISESSKEINTIIEELNQFSIDELAHKYKDTNLEQYVYKLSDFLEETNAYIKSQEIFTRKKVDNFNEEVLNLWLIVSYFCNMQCIYCLGNGGNYGRTKNLMSKETAIEAINLFWKRRNKKADIPKHKRKPLKNT